MRRWRWLVLAALGACAAGCIAIVGADTGPLGTTCKLESITGCGVCVEASCADALNQCCADTQCKTILGALDSCSSSSCVIDTSGSVAATLASCMKVSCASSCAVTAVEGGVDGTAPLYQTSCTRSGASCYCSAPGNGPGNTVQCDRTAPADSVCCADLDYPKAGTRCSCYVGGCKTTSNGCSCSTLVGGPNPSCMGGTCCQSGNDCDCDSTRSQCYSGSQVSACVATQLGCGYNEAPVANCSFR